MALDLEVRALQIQCRCPNMTPCSPKLKLRPIVLSMAPRTHWQGECVRSSRVMVILIRRLPRGSQSSRSSPSTKAFVESFIVRVPEFNVRRESIGCSATADPALRLWAHTSDQRSSPTRRTMKRPQAPQRCNVQWKGPGG